MSLLPALLCSALFAPLSLGETIGWLSERVLECVAGSPNSTSQPAHTTAAAANMQETALSVKEALRCHSYWSAAIAKLKKR